MTADGGQPDRSRILAHRGLACFTHPVRAEVSKHERMVRPSIPQGERLWSDTITLIRDEPEFFRDEPEFFEAFVEVAAPPQVVKQLR
jgi:hypothetical protein